MEAHSLLPPMEASTAYTTEYTYICFGATVLFTQQDIWTVFTCVYAVQAKTIRRQYRPIPAHHYDLNFEVIYHDLKGNAGTSQPTFQSSTMS